MIERKRDYLAPELEIVSIKLTQDILGASQETYQTESEGTIPVVTTPGDLPDDF